MTDWPALYRAVIDDLDSDEPRLVLADALQTAGNPRGELIAIQCELARLGCDRTRLAQWGLDTAGRLAEHATRDWIGDGLVTADRDRIATLRVHERRLLATQPAIGERCRWQRGFVDHACDDDLAVEVVFDAMPMIRSLECSVWSPSVLEEPRFAQLRQLRVPAIESAMIPALVERAQHWPQLRELAVASTTDAYTIAIDSLLGTPLLARLEALDLYDESVTPDQLVEVLDQATLRHLAIGTHLFAPQLLEALAGCDRASTLEVLDLVLPEGGIGYRWLAHTKRLRSLQALRILEHGAEWLEPGMLVGLAELPALRVLDLGGNHVVAQHVDELLVGDFTSLVQLGLSDCGLTPPHLSTLASAPWFDRLITLDLRDNELIAANFDPLRARNPNLQIRT